MTIGKRRQGQPLAALLGVFGLWVGVRVLLWQSPLLPFDESLGLVTARTGAAQANHVSSSKRSYAGADIAFAQLAEPAHTPSLGSGTLTSPPSLLVLPSDARQAPDTSARASAFAPAPEGPHLAPLAQVRASRQASRWSGDAWLLYRPSAAGLPEPGPFVGRYGASQAGALLRYRLQPGGHRLALYAQASTALAASMDRNVAVGLSGRPIPSVPLSVQTEMRVVHNDGGSELAPAVLAVSELAPLTLPLRIRANAYFAGGYVGGSNHTPFVGGQLRADRVVARIAGTPVRLGGGAWGGAQRGAAALDVGPAVVAEIPLARRRVAIELGYRWRVAGTAEPRSGVALVVSTGF
jgi:hypothetical protein